MKEANEINQLMLLKARGRGLYFQSYNHMIFNAEFHFKKRTRRPPKDSINSLISFGNTLLYRMIAKGIYRSKLDIRISFLHSAMQRNENLNLDITELFKPIIIDRIIFTLINKHMMDAALHFDELLEVSISLISIIEER